MAIIIWALVIAAILVVLWGSGDTLKRQPMDYVDRPGRPATVPARRD